MKRKAFARNVRGMVCGVAILLPVLVCGLSPARAHDESDAAKAAETLPSVEKTYGSKDAPLTFELFTEYSCRMCRNLFERSLRPMIADYAVPGKLYLVHRDYPTKSARRRYSLQAARWVNAAAEIGQFAPVEAALYDHQDSWVADGNLARYVAGAMSADDFKRVQKTMEGCSPPAPPPKSDPLYSDSDNCSVDPYIEHDMALGKQLPVNATPTYLILYKGQVVFRGAGYVSWPPLKQLLDSYLAKDTR
jgi:protein-disulfide isomerase